MRLECPYCGERPYTEFSYLGDANSTRPDPAGEGAERAYFEAVYMRDNPAGEHRELWYHAFGCRRWLRVTRNTRTNEIVGIQFAGEASDDTA